MGERVFQVLSFCEHKSISLDESKVESNLSSKRNSLFSAEDQQAQVVQVCVRVLDRSLSTWRSFEVQKRILSVAMRIHNVETTSHAQRKRRCQFSSVTNHRHSNNTSIDRLDPARKIQLWTSRSATDWGDDAASLNQTFVIKLLRLLDKGDLATGREIIHFLDYSRTKKQLHPCLLDVLSND